ncbi:AEC family transporter [Antarcticibacterium sp. 1MA-6-2]|uniref:AEC family transporter n=1 Tax=Antarcticibacterium sp. 1MA-6-2 TaxID=2908210 RepID=UPI001F1F75CA|nr:AEC family transporter [Antarcticibacterium sp. 1MA-6-2]UJH92640.1 AEC family transporter [Antarcticibacterium sp. 1MA-6-2]
MLNIILISICLLSGFLVRKYKALPEGSYKAVNAWVINIALLAVALKYIPHIEWDFSLMLPLLMPIMVWTGSYLLVTILGKFISIGPGTRAALILSSGLSNTSFLGFPLSEAYYGKEGLQIAILCDQATFIVMATLGIITASKASNGGSFEIRTILKKVFTFPPFIAFCLAFILPLFISLDPIEPLLENFALTLVPLALFSVGMQFRLQSLKADAKLLSVALSYKLLLAPLLIFLICIALGLSSLVARISIFEAAMAPMVTGTIIATEYNLNPKLANIILSIGIPVSLLTTFLWSLILQLL